MSAVIMVGPYWDKEVTESLGSLCTQHTRVVERTILENKKHSASKKMDQVASLNRDRR